jgi:CDP-diacylglycerol--serine O-phosphatidyltransferase
MTRVIKFIPNLLTLINLSFGLVGIILAFQTQLAWAGVMVFVAAIFDFADGFAARLLNAQSELGKQLDSLADAVTFGVLPGLIVYQMINGLLGILFTPIFDRTMDQHLMASVGIILAAAAVYRLAKFNIDTRQSHGFLGLPTPAMAIFFAAIPVIAEWQYEYNFYVALTDQQMQAIARMFYYNEFDMGIISLFSSLGFWWISGVILAFLMVSEVPIIALKFKSLKWADNKWRFAFLIVVLITLLLSFVDNIYYTGLLPWIQFLCIPIAIVELVLVSILQWIFGESN